MVDLKRPLKGTLHVLGIEVSSMSWRERLKLYRKIGFLFQEGGLMGGLSVVDNVALPLYKLFNVSRNTARDLALAKLRMVGLNLDVSKVYPTELSGGMRRRVGRALALVTDPKIMFLDEQTARLDPISAGDFDVLIKELMQSMNLTIVMVLMT